MDGVSHYRKAEQLLRRGYAGDVDRAQVHATLALAAATALSGVIGNNLAASHPINQLAHDDETITAANEWHEIATRKAQP